MNKLKGHHFTGGPDAAGYTTIVKLPDGQEAMADIIWNQEFRCWEYGAKILGAGHEFSTNYTTKTKEAASDQALVDLCTVVGRWVLATEREKAESITGWKAWRDGL